MKNINVIFIIVSFFFMIASCSKDKDTQPEKTNNENAISGTWIILDGKIEMDFAAPVDISEFSSWKPREVGLVKGVFKEDGKSILYSVDFDYSTLDIIYDTIYAFYRTKDNILYNNERPIPKDITPQYAEEHDIPYEYYKVKKNYLFLWDYENEQPNNNNVSVAIRK